MNKLLNLLFLALVATQVIAKAESETDVTPPKPPFLVPMPDLSTWTVKVSQSDTTVKLPPGARTVDHYVYSKSGSVHHVLYVWTDNSTSEIWFVGGLRIERTVGSDVVIRPSPGLVADFPELSWLSVSNYKEISHLKNSKCYEFRLEGVESQQRVKFNWAAYIDVLTKLPVSWDKSPYHFEVGPIGKLTDLTVPPEIKAKIKAYNETQASPAIYKK